MQPPEPFHEKKKKQNKQNSFSQHKFSTQLLNNWRAVGTVVEPHVLKRLPKMSSFGGRLLGRGAKVSICQNAFLGFHYLCNI